MRVDVYRRLCLMQNLPQTCISRKISRTRQAVRTLRHGLVVKICSQCPESRKPRSAWTRRSASSFKRHALLSRIRPKQMQHSTRRLFHFLTHAQCSDSSSRRLIPCRSPWPLLADQKWSPLCSRISLTATLPKYAGVFSEEPPPDSQQPASLSKDSAERRDTHSGGERATEIRPLFSELRLCAGTLQQAGARSRG